VPVEAPGRPSTEDGRRLLERRPTQCRADEDTRRRLWTRVLRQVFLLALQIRDVTGHCG
jgi:hypothetical protein